MDIQNFEIILSKLKGRTPFKPFVVALDNGEKFEVDYPDALSYRDGLGIYIAPGKKLVFFDHNNVSRMTDELLNFA